MASDIGITLSIETEADVAGIEKAQKSTEEFTRATDECDRNLAKLKDTLAKLDTALKDTGESGSAAGTKLADGMQKGAGGALTSLEGILPATNVNDLISGAWDIGSRIGETIGRAVELSARDALDWEHLFGNGDELDATALARKKSLEEVRQAHQELIDQLGKPPDDALDRYLQGLADKAREAAVQLGELKKLTSTVRKTEDEQDNEKAQRARDEIDNSSMSEPEKIRARAEAQNQADEEARIRRDERRVEDVQNAGREVDAKEQAAREAANAQTEAEIRQATAQGIMGGDQYQRAKASGADEKYLKGMFDRRAREAGYDDLNESDIPKPGQSDSPNVIAARKAAENARTEYRDAATRERGLIERNDIESDADRTKTENTNQRRTAKAEGDAQNAEKKDADKEAAAAAREVKDATKNSDQGTKELASTLKEFAKQASGSNKAIADALAKMADDLKDGASQQELTKIQSAMSQLSGTQNQAFSAFARTVDALAKGIEDSARIAAEAQRKAEQAMQKVNALR